MSLQPEPHPYHLSPGRAEVMVLAHSTGLARRLEVPWPVRLCHPISCFYASRMVHALAGSAPVGCPAFHFFAIIPSLGGVVPGVTWTVGGSPCCCGPTKPNQSGPIPSTRCLVLCAFTVFSRLLLNPPQISLLPFQCFPSRNAYLVLLGLTYLITTLPGARRIFHCRIRLPLLSRL